MKNVILLLLAGALTLASCGKDDAPVAAESITLDKNTLSLKRGGSETLTATFLPSDATDKNVAWSCDKPEIATVDANGKVSALTPGFATVTATASGKSATCAVTVEPDVYAVFYDGTEAMTRKGYLWKNGEMQEQLPFHLPQCIYVADGDIYISGEYLEDGLAGCGYMKNGTLYPLDSKKSWYNNARRILISDGNIYVAGRSLPQHIPVATLWENGVAKLLETNRNSFANSVCISDKDVYAAGYVLGEGGEFKATYWKNGVAHELYPGAIHDIQVVNGVLYAAGRERDENGNDTAVLWTDGQKIYLPEGSVILDMYISDKGDIYAVGYEYKGDKREGRLWKNGNVTKFTTNGQGNTIAVYGDDVYISGQSDRQAVLWKNGIPTILPGVLAYSVFLY